MYSREDRTGSASVYIPPSYRGNALFFENAGQEEECPADRPQEHKCAQEEKKASECRESGLLGRLGGILSSDSAVIVAVALFLLFSKKDDCGDRGDDLLTLLLIALVLL